jgi:hypothetical protein
MLLQTLLYPWNGQDCVIRVFSEDCTLRSEVHKDGVPLYECSLPLTESTDLQTYHGSEGSSWLIDDAKAMIHCGRV